MVPLKDKLAGWAHIWVAPRSSASLQSILAVFYEEKDISPLCMRKEARAREAKGTGEIMRLFSWWMTALGFTPRTAG